METSYGRNELRCLFIRLEGLLIFIRISSSHSHRPMFSEDGTKPGARWCDSRPTSVHSELDFNYAQNVQCATQTSSFSLEGPDFAVTGLGKIHNKQSAVIFGLSCLRDTLVREGITGSLICPPKAGEPPKLYNTQATTANGANFAVASDFILFTPFRSQS